MNEYSIGQLVRIKEDFDEGEDYYGVPSINDYMLFCKKRLFYVQEKMLLHTEGQVLDTFRLLGLDGKNDGYLWKSHWFEPVDISEALTEGQLVQIQINRIGEIRQLNEVYPYMTDELKTYANLTLGGNKLEIEHIYEKEIDGQTYYACSLKGHPFLWHPFLFTRKGVSSDGKFNIFYSGFLAC